jgi:hypothetical protein
MRITTESEFFTKILQSRLFWALIAFGLAIVFSYAHAQSNKEVNQEPVPVIPQEQTVVQKPACDPVLHPSQDKSECFYKEPKKVSATPSRQYSRPVPTNEHPYSRDEVVQLIKHYAAIYKVDENLLLRIAKCESGYRWDAMNNHSTASGVFQYLVGTWKNTPAGKQGISVFDADANVHMAVASIANGGLSHWNASKHCWN